MTVALLSDLHMREEYAERVAAELGAVLDRLATEHDPAHAFVLGDLVEDGESAGTDRQNARRVHATLEEWPVPVTYLLGNHDVENLGKSALRDLLGQESFYGVERVDDTAFVFLDSADPSVGGATGRLGPEQLGWLEQTLPGLSDAVVLVHHPVGNFDLSTNEWFSQFPERAYLWDRKELLARLDADSVRGTISGHIHWTGYDEFRGLPHVSLNAFSKERPGLPVTGTYAVFDAAGTPTVRVQTRRTAGVCHPLSTG